MTDIYLTDAEFEAFSLSEDGMLAVPAVLTEDSDGRVSLETYALTEDISKAFAAQHGHHLFSDEARGRLISMLSPVMERYGYSAARETGDILLEYRMTSAPETTARTVILRTNEELSHYPADTTLWNLELDDEDPLDVICAVIENGHIAAYAAANDFSDGVCEVNVECAVQYRQRGFGSACAAGFARHILSETEAECVSYVCREKNTASLKTACRAGFKLCGRSASFVFYR